MRLQASRRIAVQFDDGQLVKAFADRLGRDNRQAGADFGNIAWPFCGLVAETCRHQTDR